MIMDTTFLLDEADRANFFRLIMQSIGRYTHICLWLYSPHPSNCLYFMDGFFYEENNQPSSSSGSRARRLFDEYRNSSFPMVENECVPGLAFRNSRPYMEVQELNLQRLASTEAQRLFYQEARIKTAVFMGCKSGEIEIGFANVSQLDIEKEMKNLFPDDLSRSFSPIAEPFWRPDQNLPSSSSSSLRSLTDSPEYSSLLFNIPSTSHFPEALRDQVPTMAMPQMPTSTSPHHQALQALAAAANIQFPAPETENSAIARAILNVLSSHSSSSSLSSHQTQQNLPYGSHRENSKPSAFKSYVSALGPRTSTQIRANNARRQSLLNRSVLFYRSLNFLRVRERMQTTRPTSTQLHHMISERKRREKLNESFQALRSLLPPGTKKDKASLLTTTREYLSSLKAQVAELTRRNQLSEAQQLLSAKEVNEEETSSSNERLMVRISAVSGSSSPDQERIVELRVTVRGECPMEDMTIRILEFLKQVQNVSLVSMETNIIQMTESTSSTRITMRLRIVGNDWDEAAFREAVRRVVADLA
ncbi:putative transcription factor bHLH041 [Juglans microcarpa x Juglans regia]|uniref:putative transcription factor bHLH041 n=1 Tax=Juglans microcarpa x Juglans regia TaxID=2249226 RepID=UPI001B7DFCCD|nr:putative transcription factor bHLH041 [Juglans microcarpa x Juglans regia]